MQEDEQIFAAGCSETHKKSISKVLTVFVWDGRKLFQICPMFLLNVGEKIAASTATFEC